MRKEAVERTMEKCGGRCVKCGAKENLEVDHIIPISKGGEHSEHNFQILCRKCNRSKKDKIDWLVLFKIDESPDYILLGDGFIDIMKQMSPKEFKLLTQEMATIHQSFWKNNNRGLS